MISGLCNICSRPGQVHTCVLCGRQVCATHFDSAKSVCVICGEKGRTLIT